MSFVKSWRTVLIVWWKPLIAVLVPLALLPILIYSDSQESRCGFLVLWMALYFLLEPVPLPATALLPVAACPLLGLLSTTESTLPYMKDTIMMYVGSLTLAVAVEHCNLHKRIALRVLLTIGTGPRWLMLGFMTTTAFLSMWISNTATTAMMVPIVDAVLQELEREDKMLQNSQAGELNMVSIPSSRSSFTWVAEPVKNHYQVSLQMSSNATNVLKRQKLRDSLLLSIAYAANCGGTATVIGSGPNLVLKGLIEELYPGSTELTFASWLIYNGPVMLICVFICWAGLQLFFNPSCCNEENTQASAKNAVLKSYQELGSITFHEIAVAFLFFVVVILWFLRDPQFMRGWATYLSYGKYIRDATPAIAIALLLFVIPSRPSFREPSPPLLDWKTAQKGIPWGVLLLLGSGFVIADAAKRSGLSIWMSNQLSVLHALSSGLMVTALTLLASALTEVISNMSMATILLPVVAEMAIAVHVHPFLLMLPVTIGCSFAMILPVGNPSNAIVFDASHMTTFDMLKPGLLLKLLCCAVEIVMIQTLGMTIFNLNEFPSWAGDLALNSTLPVNATQGI